MMKSLKGLTMLLVLLSICAFGSVAAAQDTGNDTHPYIFDGRITESPLKLDIDVTEMRARVGNNNQRYIDHFATDEFDTVVEDYKGRYKKNEPIAPGIKIKGYVFLSQQQAWSFTLKETDSNIEYVLIVKKGEERGTVLSLNTRRYGTKSAAYKRSWKGYSPRKLKPASVPLRAF